MTQIVGTYENSRDFGFVVSDNPKFSRDVFIPRKDSQGIKDGDKVVVEITSYGSKNRNPEGKNRRESGKLPCTWNRYPCHCKKLWHSKRISG